jgi:hypothetical protein
MPFLTSGESAREQPEHCDRTHEGDFRPPARPEAE